MSQIRYHFQAVLQPATTAYEELDRIFEDEGLALAILEIDEKADIHEVSVYAPAEAGDVEGRISAVLDTLPEPPALLREELPDIDWVSHSLQGLHAVRAGRFFVHGAHERDGVRPGEIPIEIEAGQAFGTGHHGTTAGCLEMIGRVMRAEHPRNALDLGAGSAVLAIAIARLAHIPVLATDIDPIATRIAGENARLNHVANRVRTITAAGFHDPAFAEAGPFDLIAANILARPLMRLAPGMARQLAPNGSLVLSGILEHQRRSVIAAYAGQRFRHVTTLHREGWVTIHMKR